MKISDKTSTLTIPEFTLAYDANFTASRSKDFQKLLEDVQAAAARIQMTDEVLNASASLKENSLEKVFTVTLTIRTSSWYSGGELLNELVTKILADAKIVEYSSTDTAFERFRKSQSERFVIPSGHSTRTIAEAA
jgi:hypothetical protein